MFLMMLSNKIAQMICYTAKGAARDHEQKYLDMTSPEPLVKIQERSAWLNNMLLELKIEGRMGLIGMLSFFDILKNSSKLNYFEKKQTGPYCVFKKLLNLKKMNKMSFSKYQFLIF